MTLSFVKGGVRTKKVTAIASSSSSSFSSQNDDWGSKHPPQELKEVAVHHSYVKSVKTWLTDAAAAHHAHGDVTGFKPWILVLCGHSGCGKSTLVEALCADMNLNVIPWTDDSWENDTSAQDMWESRNMFAGRQSLTTTSDSANQSMSKEQELESFVRSTAYPTLNLQRPPKRTMLSPSPPPMLGKRSHSSSITNTNSATGDVAIRPREVIVIDGSDDDEFDDKNVSKYANLNRTSSNVKGIVFSDLRPKIILMHDLPHADKVDTAELNSRLASQLCAFKAPVVIISSGVSGKDDMQFTLRSIVPTEVESACSVTSIYQGACTTLILLKALKRIRSKERNASSVTDAQLHEIAERSAGDIRHAILSLQLTAATSSKNVPSSNTKKKKIEDQKEEDNTVSPMAYVGDDEPSTSGKNRDAQYSSLHTVAKLANGRLNQNGYLDWSHTPEEVLRGCDMNTELVFQFIQSQVLKSIEINAIMWIPEDVNQRGIVELESIEMASRALDYCSDAAVLLHRKYDPSEHLDRGQGVFPDEYVTAYAGRLGSVSKGVGAEERTAVVKQRGVKGIALTVRRPPVLDINKKRIHVSTALRLLSSSLQEAGTSSANNSISSAAAGVFVNGSSMATLSIDELALHVAPILKECSRDKLSSSLGPKVIFALDRWFQAMHHALASTGGAFVVPSREEKSVLQEAQELEEDIDEFDD